MPHNSKRNLRYVIIIATILLAAAMFSSGSLNAFAAATTPTPTPFPMASDDTGFSRQNPAPPNTRVSIETTLNTDGSVVEWEMSISQVEFGPDTTAKIAKLNSFNEKPESGKDYLIAYVQGRVFSIKGKTQTFSVSSGEFGVVSDGNILTAPDSFLVSGLNPILNFKGFAGAKFSGWIVLSVFSDDPAPLITYGLQSDGIHGIWFTTNAEISPTQNATEIATESSTATQSNILADPLTAGNDFMNALIANDFTKAFGMVYPSQQINFGGTPDGMRQLFMGKGWTPSSFTSTGVAALTSGQVVVNGTGNFDGNIKYVTLVMENDGDAWKIAGFNVSTNQPTAIPTA